MEQCSGTVVIAFERIYIQAGIESRGGPIEQPIEDQKLPTVWNQIESGMAYVLGHPLLLIVEDGLRFDGLMEPDHDWHINWLDVDHPFTHQQDMIETINSWKEQVTAFKQKKEAQSDR
jgi:hypothetical protein